MSDDPREEIRLLVRRARMLVSAEREGGIVDIGGTPAPAPAPVASVASARVAAPSAPRSTTQPTYAAATQPARQAAPTPVAPRADATAAGPTTPPPRVPFVRALDLPANALAPFDGLDAEVAACRRCELCSGRTRTVFGEGNASARLVLCGEAPGFEEDQSGRPFVGASGELLTAMIEKGLKLRREDVFILNTIKCRPPGNRAPLAAELLACRPFLERQLAVIRPTVIIALGNPASRALLGDVPGIKTIRGRVFDGFGAKVVPTFHPAYVLRDPSSKRDVWTDLKTVTRLLEEANDRGPTG